jgi:hypothetical protein
LYNARKATGEGSEKMRILLIPFVLMLILVQLPFGPQPQEKPEEEPSPVKGWWLVKYFAVPPTQYSKAGGIIKAESLGARSTLFKEVEEKQRDYPVLSWRWKISNVVRSAIETRKDRHDAAARIILVFGKEKGFKFFGREPAGLRIEYIWASHLPRHQWFDHPAEKDCKILVLESGDGKAGQWVSERRNLRKDFKEVFHTDSPGVTAVGIQTDTDHSNERVIAWYSDPTLQRK